MHRPLDGASVRHYSTSTFAAHATPSRMTDRSSPLRFRRLLCLLRRFPGCCRTSLRSRAKARSISRNDIGESENIPSDSCDSCDTSGCRAVRLPSLSFQGLERRPRFARRCGPGLRLPAPSRHLPGFDVPDVKLRVAVLKRISEPLRFGPTVPRRLHPLVEQCFSHGRIELPRVSGVRHRGLPGKRSRPPGPVSHTTRGAASAPRRRPVSARGERDDARRWGHRERTSRRPYGVRRRRVVAISHSQERRAADQGWYSELERKYFRFTYVRPRHTAKRTTPMAQA